MDFVTAKEVLDILEQLDADSQESILRALNLAEQVEIASEDFYLKEVEKTRGTELERFFSFMVEEEAMHLLKIEELTSKIEQGDLEKIGFPESIPPKINSIKAGRDEMTAILYALWREKKAEEFYRSASDKTKGYVKTFFIELANFEKGHVELLEKYVEAMHNANELIMG